MRNVQRPSDTIYFATCDFPDFPIKIGISNNAEWRLHKMQTTLPYRVILLGTVPGDQTAEKMMHLDFRHLCLRGEWFRRMPELLAHINEVSIGPKRDRLWTDRMNATDREQRPSNVVKISGF